VRFYRLLLRFNAIAFALLLTGIMAVAASFFLSEKPSYDQHAPTDILSNSGKVEGEEVKTSQGTITIYKSPVPDDDEAVRDVRFVAMKTGKIARLAEDGNAPIYRGETVGKLGYVALVETGRSNDRPVFDLVFVSFPRLERFMLARAVDALDSVEILDDSTFSAVVWDKIDTARFIIVETQSGAIKLSRALDFSQSGRSPQ
jgi:hypothetical protein